MYESGFHYFIFGHEAPLWQAVVLTFVMEVHIQKKKCAWLGGGGGSGRLRGLWFNGAGLGTFGCIRIGV